MVKKIVSGGQTGVDRAALDVAIQLGISHGGWCPRGRRSETGPIPDHYELVETQEEDYTIRTEKNVLDSDATLILYCDVLKGGTKLTRKLARRHGRPYLEIELSSSDDRITVPSVRDWLMNQQVKILNVAGPRESNVPGISNMASDFLVKLFA